MGQTLSRSRRNAFQNQRPLASLCLEYPGPCHSSSNDAKSDSMVCAGLFFRVCLPEGGKLCWCEHSLDGGGGQGLTVLTMWMELGHLVWVIVSISVRFSMVLKGAGV